MDQTEFSVVICTRNRSRLLERSIASVFAQQYPPARFELIVVDNGSTDGTRQVIERCLADAPISASSYLEHSPGVSRARNRGALLARFAYVAFLDDDATAVPGWLATYDEVIRTRDAQVVGGRVEPVLDEGVAPPFWWRESDIRGLFGLDHHEPLHGQPVARIAWPLWLGGGNCVYSKEVLRAHGGFRVNHGPSGRRRRLAEDIELNVRLEKCGVSIYYAHDAVIRHLVPRQRLASVSILRRAYWAGRTDAAARAHVVGHARHIPVARLLRTAMRCAAHPNRTLALFRLAYDVGYIQQSRIAVDERGQP